MGKSQHVTPHPKGGWQVKGAGNSKATARTTTQAEAIYIAKILLLITSLNWLFIGLMEKFVKRTPMATIPIRPKDKVELL